MTGYIGDKNGKATKIKNIYIGDKNGKAAKVKKVYIGDKNGKAKLIWKDEPIMIQVTQQIKGDPDLEKFFTVQKENTSFYGNGSGKFIFDERIGSQKLTLIAKDDMPRFQFYLYWNIYCAGYGTDSVDLFTNESPNFPNIDGDSRGSYIYRRNLKKGDKLVFWINRAIDNPLFTPGGWHVYFEDMKFLNTVEE